MTVKAVTSTGDRSLDRLTVALCAGAAHHDAIPVPATDAHAADAWPEQGLLGMQPGPNGHGG